jgi:DNA gyrase subunit A
VGVSKSDLVEKIAEVIIAKKLPGLSTCATSRPTDVPHRPRAEARADPQLVMAYLYKHTPLQMNLQVNITCLVPVERRPTPTGAHPANDRAAGAAAAAWA